jgi:hypothetical protein
MRSETVTEELYPHGLRCASCDSEISRGEKVFEREASAVETVLAHVPVYDDTPVVALVCHDCATQETDPE